MGKSVLSMTQFFLMHGAEHSQVSPRITLSWFDQHGTFKMGCSRSDKFSESVKEGKSVLSMPQFFLMHGADNSQVSPRITLSWLDQHGTFKMGCSRSDKFSESVKEIS